MVQKTDNVSLTDQLQGWGTVGAVVVALLIALIGWSVDARRREKDRSEGEAQREKDREYAESQRAQDRAEAERQRAADRAEAAQRLNDERQAAEERLQRQLEEGRIQVRQGFAVVQLQRAGELYAELRGLQREWNEERFAPRDDPGRRSAERVAVQRLRAHVVTLSAPHASLLKAQVFGSSSLDETTRREAIQRASDDSGDAVGPIDDAEIYRELADNIADLLGPRSSGDA
ncbi:hypothetical protein DQ384_30930 [Sphaerisporangium album]|uniref:Uncharacterized protein n=1 Tax=Sphaerisporangium album TaxID=509200 RepID=A0A367F6E5_9ACTN|nr:hypothetical protein DQ384_30930 [Sphaerisporangium album]